MSGRSWPMVQIQSFAEVVTGGTPSTSVREYWDAGSIPWLNSGELNKGVITTATNFITEAGLKNSAATMMPANTVLVALTGATTGISALLTMPACANQSVTGILPSQSHDPRYLLHYLRSIRERIVSASWGGAQKHISQGYVKELKIPLPPLDEQRRVAEILDKGNTLRAKRVAAIATTNSLFQSVFLSMFGNPIRNEKRWNLVPLGRAASIERGKFSPRPRNDPAFYGGKYPFIQTGDISASGGRLCTWTQTLNEKGIHVSRSFPRGTIVVAIVGATIGASAILDVEVYCPDSVIGIAVDPQQATAEYVEYILRFWRPIFVAQAPETARANINLGTFKPLEIPLPPVELQKQFSYRIAAINSVMEIQKRSAARIEELLFCLQHRAFNGAL